MFSRPACQKALKNIKLEEQPEMVQVAGGYNDIIIDNVGVARNICSLEEVKSMTKKKSMMIFKNAFYPGLGTKIRGSSLGGFVDQSFTVSG